MRFPLYLLVLFLIMIPVSAQSNPPQEMTYHWEQYSYWCGEYLITAIYDNDGTATIEYTIIRDSGCENFLLFDEEFTNHYESLYGDMDALFASGVDTSQVLQWETNRTHSESAICDGGGFDKILTMNWSDSSVYVEHIVDNDSCNGTRTTKSHDAILTQINYIHQYTLDVIRNEPTVPDPADVVDLSVDRITVLVTIFILPVILQRTKLQI